MYVVKGVYWIVRNGVKQPPKPSREFRTAMEMLHWAIKAGLATRTFSRGYYSEPVTMENVSIPYAGSSEWEGDWYFSVDQVAAMRTALSRYRQIVRYFREIEPEWAEIPGSKIYWADNSIEIKERDKYGRERRVQLAPPSGDRCF